MKALIASLSTALLLVVVRGRYQGQNHAWVRIGNDCLDINFGVVPCDDLTRVME